MKQEKSIDNKVTCEVCGNIQIMADEIAEYKENLDLAKEMESVSHVMQEQRFIDLSKISEKMKTMKLAVLEAEEQLKTAKAEYDHYASTILPTMMRTLGVESLTLSSGGSISLVRNYHCQPNKNAADQKILMDWLRSHGGGHLIKTQCRVNVQDVGELDKLGIAHVEEDSVNTMSLKSFLKDQLGITSGIKRIDIEDIPKAAHFYEVCVAEVSL